MSGISRLSFKKGPKGKPHPPGFVASGAHVSLQGSSGHDSLVTSPVSPPLSLSGDVLSPVCTTGASEASLTKAERKKLTEVAEKRRKAERRERERVEAGKKARQEAERKARKKEKESRKSKGKKPNAKSLQDERSPYSEDWLHSSTLVSSQHAAGPQHTATPGAGHSQETSGGRNDSEKASGVNAYALPSTSPYTLEPYESEPRSVLSSSCDAGSFEGERQSYQKIIDDLTQSLEKEQEVSKKARDELERELRRKDDELRALQLRLERELQEALEARDRTKQEEFQKEKELKQKEEEFQVAMQAKTEEYCNLLREQMEVKQREVDEKQKDLEMENIASKKARDDLERELKRKDDELRTLQWRKECELEEALDRTKQEELQKKEEELKQKEEEFQVAMQAKTEEWHDLLREQMEVKQREVNEKQKETKKLQAQLREVLEHKEIKIYHLKQQVRSVEGIEQAREELKNVKGQYEAVSRDRGFMEESMTALKKREEELISKLQQCEDALSDAVSKRQDLHHEYIQEKQSRERAERECIELRVANEELGTKLGVEGGQDGSVATLKEKMEKLVKENHELREEIEARVQEDQYEKLLKDYEAVNRDRGFMEESMTALKKRNEELTSELLQYKEALSDAVKKRQDLHHEFFLEKESRERAERECIELRVANEKLGIILGVEGQDGSVATLTDKMEKLVRENHEFKEEIDAQRQEAAKFQEDFLQERKDRKSAYTHQLQTMSTELVRTTTELDTHKENLANMEAMMQKRAQQTRQQMAEKEQELGLMNQEIMKLCEEVQLRVQQVKQYKKQADKYMEEAVMQKELQENLQGERVRLRQQLQRQEEEAAAEEQAARQRSQLLQQRLDAALAEVQHWRHSPQITPPSHKPWNIPRQEVKIMTEIGRGAWGTVYNGKYQGQSVAVKSLHPEILDERTIERLRREVQIMAQVRHPNLLRFIGAVFDSDVYQQHPPLIVLELLDVDLRMAYQTKRLQGSSKIPIFRDIAYALHYLHEHHEPIIHRDVSAPNVLLEALPNGMWRAKVSDFGSANLARLAKTMGEGAIIYTAPETFPQAHEFSSRPPPQTTKMDVFSYGVLLCEVITSQMPDPERFWIMLQQVEKQWPLMHKLIICCRKQNADERPTMAEILDQLNALPQPKPN